MNERKVVYDRYFELLPKKLGSQTYTRMMSMSFEAISVVLDRIEPAETILDAGAGVSTWMLAHCLPANKVTTVDSDPEYLKTIESLVHRWESRSTNHVFGTEYAGARYDCVLFDYMHVADRPNLLPEFWACAKRWMYVDDMHFTQYYGLVTQWVENEPTARISPVMEKTMDSYGRWGAFVERCQG